MNHFYGDKVIGRMDHLLRCGVSKEVLQIKDRKCLRCGDKFRSVSKANRMCSECRKPRETDEFCWIARE